jgi:O-antigen/teichoic acid export membrane protein
MMRDRLRKSLQSQIGSKLFSLAVAIGIGGWTARYLGPSALGTLSYVGAIVGLLSPLGNLGVKGSLSTLLCANPTLPGLLGTALCIELVGTALVALMLVPVALLAKDSVIPALLGLAVLANLFNSAEVFEAELFNRHRGSQVGLADFTQTLIGSVASTVALLLQAPLLLFGALPAFQSLVRSSSLYRAAGAMSLRCLVGSANWPAARQLIRRGWPLMVSGLAIMIYLKSDLLMLQWLRSSQEVGEYAVSARTAESLYFLPVILSQTLFPSLSNAESAGGDRASSIEVTRLYRLAWLVGLAMVIITMTILPLLVFMVYGFQYRASSVALIWLAPAAFGVATGCASSAWLNLQGLESLGCFRTIMGALINVILNLALIPKMGIYGAALSTSLAYNIAPFAALCFRSKLVVKNIRLLAFPFSRNHLL